MKYRLLGNSGLRVSEAALGTMTFGDEWGWGSPKAEAQKVYETYREAGGNFIDTANFYTGGCTSGMRSRLWKRSCGAWMTQANTLAELRGCPVNRDHQAKWTECLINAAGISDKPPQNLMRACQPQY